jgi:hypothetical protein
MVQELHVQRTKLGVGLHAAIPAGGFLHEELLQRFSGCWLGVVLHEVIVGALVVLVDPQHALRQRFGQDVLLVVLHLQEVLLLQLTLCHLLFKHLRDSLRTSCSGHSNSNVMNVVISCYLVVSIHQEASLWVQDERDLASRDES